MTDHRSTNRIDLREGSFHSIIGKIFNDAVNQKMTLVVWRKFSLIIGWWWGWWFGLTSALHEIKLTYRNVCLDKNVNATALGAHLLKGSDAQKIN